MQNWINTGFMALAKNTTRCKIWPLRSNQWSKVDCPRQKPNNAELNLKIWWNECQARCVRTSAVLKHASTHQTLFPMVSKTGCQHNSDQPWLTSLYPFYLYPFCRTWDGTKNLQTSYVSNYLIQTNMKIYHHRYHSTLTLLSNWHFQVSYYCEPPKKVIQRFPHGATKQTHRWFRWNVPT